jgi:DnaJ-class molecular chaperone
MASQDKKQQNQRRINPGDEAPRGTPGSGEDICPECSGSGKLRGGKCPNCGGSGRVIEGIGGG